MASLDGTTLNSVEGWRSTQRNFRGDKSLHTSTSRTLRENNEMNLDKHSNIVSSSAIGRNRETTSSISLCESRDDSQVSIVKKKSW
ncbi:hypothetical protein AB6A40_011069 [Gnathostoma spinigerum]|uniref:Uncharacterized protein n=1 Tax=Gnathostoma spinigerum TaxID=75299 RepID=A0ABD6F494_9BILA